MPGPGGGISDIDALTNAAISAAMAEERLYGESPAIGYRDVGVYVGSDGVLRWADGDPFDPPYDYTGDWDSWRSAIASLVEPWEGRPTLGPFTDQVDALSEAADLLRPGVDTTGEGTGSDIMGGGALRDAINSLTGDLSGMDGQTVWAFRTRYADHLHTINEGQFALAFVIGQCVAAEQAIWDKADLDYRELISQGTAAFLAARDYQTLGSGGGDFSTELKVAGAILGLAGIFATGGAATAVAIGSFGVSLLQDFAPQGGAPEPVVSGGTANEVLSSLSKALDTLREEIAKQETAIGQCLEHNLGKVRQAPHLFDLASPPILDQERPEPVGFAVDQTRMRLSGTRTCPRVATGFADAATAAHRGFGAGPWTRPSYFGASTGSYPSYAELLGELEYAAQNTGYEITKAGKLLALSADYFDQADGSAQEALARIRTLVRTYADHYPQRPEESRPDTAVDGWAMSLPGRP